MEEEGRMRPAIPEVARHLCTRTADESFGVLLIVMCNIISVTAPIPIKIHSCGL